MSVKRLLDREGDRRGVSNVLGMVLVVGMIVIATTVIVVVGATAFAQSESTVSMESAVTAMEKLNSELLQVAAQSSERATVSMPSMEDANLQVENTGWVNISVEYDNGTVVKDKTTGRIRLGKIVYRQDDQSVAIQGGGVWRTNRGGNSVAMVDQPTFQYRYGNGHPTLVFPIINLTGTSVSGGEVTVSQLSPPADKLPSVNPVQPGRQLNITVKSDYYLGWRGLFKSQANGSVKLLGNERVRLILKGPTLKSSGGTSPGAILAPYSDVYGTNHNLIDSYDSRVGPYSKPSQRHNGTFSAAQDNFTPNSHVTIKGQFNVGGYFKSANHVHITGAVRVGGDAKIDTPGVKIGNKSGNPLSVQGNLTVSNPADLYGGAIVEGDIPKFRGISHKVLSAKGNISLYSAANIKGSLIAGGELVYRGTETVDGRIHTGGEIQFKSNSVYRGPRVNTTGRVVLNSGAEIHANVTSTKDIILKDSNLIDGVVRTSGSVNVTGGSKIAGPVWAGGNVTITSNSNVTGDIYVAGSVRGSGGHSGAVHHVSVSADPDPKEPLEAAKPRVPKPSISPATSLIERRTQALNNTSYWITSTDPNAAIEQNGGCHPCRLDSGNYYLDRLKIRNWDNEKLVLNTSGGDIDIAVDGKVHLTDDVKIIGDGNVEIFVNSTSHATHKKEVKIGAQAKIGNVSTDDATQLTMYTRPDANVTFSYGNPEFVGVIYGPGSPSKTGTGIKITKNAEIFGSLIGNVWQMSMNADVHYDRALQATGGGTTVVAHGPEQVLYIQLSEQKVGVS